MTNYFNLIADMPKELTGNPAKESQVQMYQKLCTEKELEPVDVSTMNGRQLYELNAELMKYYKASPAQLSRIEKSVELLESIGVSVTLPDLSSLTGGREGTASLIITKLDELLAKNDDKFPPTESQLNFLKDMYLCVDIPFEDVGVSRRVDLEDGQWRKATPDEFISACSKAFTKNSATEFLNKHKNIFSQWKVTRPSIGQMKRVRDLESRLSDDSVVREQPIAIMIDGEPFDLAPVKDNKPKGTTYTPLSDDDMLLFDSDGISEYITQLEAELSRRGEWAKTEPYDEAFFALRTPNSSQDAQMVEYDAVVNILHQLEAIAGWDSEDLHEAFNMELVKNDSPEGYEENKQVIKGFMTLMIEENAIDFNALMEFVKESRTLQRILLEV